MSSRHETNRRAWDQLARSGFRCATPIRAEELAQPRAALDGAGWLPESLAQRRVLCLGSGGGRQSALFAACGAVVTVVDLSPAMLEMDRQVAEQHGFDVHCVQGSIDDLSPLPAGHFEIVWQPVSTCYVPEVAAVYREVARVIQPAGLYVSQHKQPASLQAAVRADERGLLLVEPYYRTGPLPPVADSVHREPQTHEYLHRWEQLLGELCRAGFVVEDLVEPFHAQPLGGSAEFAARSRYVAPYVRIKARRIVSNETTARAAVLAEGASPEGRSGNRVSFDDAPRGTMWLPPG